jgi:hypothetical protein
MNIIQKASILFATASIILFTTGGVISTVKADTLKASPLIMAQTPITTMTKKSRDQIAITIKEAEFKFKGTLKRTSGNIFIGEDRQVRVIYDKGTSHVIVINKLTGDEFYNYIFSITDEGRL